jgi:hypothetical protein
MAVTAAWVETYNFSSSGNTLQSIKAVVVDSDVEFSYTVDSTHITGITNNALLKTHATVVMDLWTAAVSGVEAAGAAVDYP